MPDSSSLGSVVLYHFPLSPWATSAEALPMQRHNSVIPPLFGSSDADFRRPHRQALVSMNSGKFVGEVQPMPLVMQGLLVEVDIFRGDVMVEMQDDYAWWA